MLGFGSFTKLATVAEMAALTPMCWLIIFGAYRLGRSLMNDVAGGFAALLLFATTEFERAHSMRGTAVAFALVAIGLGFLLDQNRRPIKIALGALALGTAVASHAIVGALALATGGTALLIGLPSVRAKDFLAEVSCLFGAVLVAVPELTVAMSISLPYPILPLLQLAGVLVIWIAASSLRPMFTAGNRFSVWIARGLVLALLLLLVWRPSSMMRIHDLAEGFPMLFAACILGLAALGLSDLKWPVGVFATAGALMVIHQVERCRRGKDQKIRIPILSNLEYHVIKTETRPRPMVQQCAERHCIFSSSSNHESSGGSEHTYRPLQVR